MAGAHGEGALQMWMVRIAYVNRALTVPLLWSWSGFEVEGLHEIKSGMTKGHTANTGPQIDDVAFLAAVGVEAVENVLFQVDAEGSATAVAAVDRAGTAALRP